MLSYEGFQDVVLSDDEMSNLYCNLQDNKFGCLENEYLIIRNSNNEIKDYLKWVDNKFVHVTSQTINNDFIGKVKPKNPQQILALNMLLDSRTTVNILSGRFGAGKDFLMIAAALDLIKKNRFDKIVYIRNNIEVKNTRPLGALPGELNDKLLPFAMPFADHVGGLYGLEYFLKEQKLEMVHLGFVRGRDIKNSIIYCTEAENLSTEHVQLLISRVGEGSALWLNGDTRQIDDKVFERCNGLSSAIDKLKGHPRFGYVNLIKTERSETAAMADLLD